MRRQRETNLSALIQGIETLTGKNFPEKEKSAALTGDSEINLVRSGLEDTMRERAIMILVMNGILILQFQI